MTPFRKCVSSNFSKETNNPNPSPMKKIWFGLFWFGAGGGTRTRTPSLVMDFESTSSTNSNTPARWGKVYNIFREISSTNYAASSSVSGGINIRFISVGSLMPGTCSVKLYCHMSTA